MIRIGVMGHGGRISGVINSCLRGVEADIRVVGIVDPDEAGARARLADCDKQDVVFYKNLKTMIKQARPDALAIGTRCNLHTKYAIEAAAYDLPLYLEKPVAINMRQARSLEQAFVKSKCPVVISFPLRVSPLCAITRQYIEEKRIGTPEHIMATNYVPYGTVYWEHEYRNFAITQGLFLQKATHDLDYMMYLMGEPIVRVSAMMTTGRIFDGRRPADLVCSKCDETETCLESPINRKRVSGHFADHPCVFCEACGEGQSNRNEESSSCLVEFASGVHGVYTQVFYSRRDAGLRGARISGYLGTLDFDWFRNDLKYIRHHEPFSDTIVPSGTASHFGGDAELAHDFISMIQSNAKPRTTIWHGIQSVYACLAAKESAEKGRFVNVRQVGA
jgi:predicted dehydrogenase